VATLKALAFRREEPAAGNASATGAAPAVESQHQASTIAPPARGARPMNLAAPDGSLLLSGEQFNAICYLSRGDLQVQVRRGLSARSDAVVSTAQGLHDSMAGTPRSKAGRAVSVVGSPFAGWRDTTTVGQFIAAAR
jgi:hypothetical protein